MYILFTESNVVTYCWRGPGRLMIRHNANPSRIYILPIKFPNVEPMPPTPMSTPANTFLETAKTNQRRHDALGQPSSLTIGPFQKSRRSGNVRRAAVIKGELCAATGEVVEKTTFLQSREWETHGTYKAICLHMQSDNLQLEIKFN
jgi:hypothetical protein